MYQLGFWKDLGERVLSTFLDAFIAAVTVTAVIGETGIGQVDWGGAASIAGLAAVIAAAKGLAVGAGGSATGASFGTAVPADSARGTIEDA